MGKNAGTREHKPIFEGNKGARTLPGRPSKMLRMQKKKRLVSFHYIIFSTSSEFAHMDMYEIPSVQFCGQVL